MESTSSGIGLSVSHRFVADGHDVVILDVDGDAADAAAAALSAAASLGVSLTDRRTSSRIVVISAAQRLQHIPAFFRKMIDHLHYLQSSVREAVGYLDFDARELRCVP